MLKLALLTSLLVHVVGGGRGPVLDLLPAPSLEVKVGEHAGWLVSPFANTTSRLMLPASILEQLKEQATGTEEGSRTVELI